MSSTLANFPGIFSSIRVKFFRGMSEPKYKASEVAARFNVKPVTVRAWLKRGLFPNAVLEETILGKVWLIPESDLKDFRPPEMGRPKEDKGKY